MTTDPKWWRPEHNSAWDRVKGAMKRDWEQTKAELTGRDTEWQAKGKVSIQDWDKIEYKYRYGVGAREQYGTDHKEWSERLESKLREEWQDLRDGTTWDEAKNFVRRGYERARK